MGLDTTELPVDHERQIAACRWGGKVSRGLRAPALLRLRRVPRDHILPSHAQRTVSWDIHILGKHFGENADRRARAQHAAARVAGSAPASD